MKNTILIFIFFVLFSLFVQKMSGLVITDRNSYELPQGLDVFSRSILIPRLNFDGRNYLDIANQGYFVKGIYNLRAFYPMYPLLVHLVSLGGLLNPIYIGLLLSSLFCFLSFYLINKMFGWKVLLLVSFFPTSFYLLSYYTESLFLFLSLLSFLFIKEKKFWYASLVIALATATRSVGLALIPVLFYEIYKNKFKDLYSLAIAPLGLLFYMLFTQFQTGDFMQIFNSQKSWGRELGAFAPVNAIITSISNVIQGPLMKYDNNFVYPVIVLELSFLIFTIVLIIKSYNKLDINYWIYLVTSVGLILMGGTLSAIPRYLLVIFPISIYLSKMLNGNKLYFYFFMCSILNIFMSTLFYRNYWVG